MSSSLAFIVSCPSRREHAVSTCLSCHQWLAQSCVLRALCNMISLLLYSMESRAAIFTSALHLIPSRWNSLVSPLHRLTVRQVCTAADQGLAWPTSEPYFVPLSWASMSLASLEVEVLGLLIGCSSSLISYWHFYCSGHVAAWVLHPLFQNKWDDSSAEPWVFHTRAKEEELWHPRQEHHRFCNLVIVQEGFYSIFILL